MTLATFPYDTADYLDTEEAIAAFAEEALSDAEPASIGHLVRTIVRAQGLNALADSTGLPRRDIVEALSGEDPNGFETLKSVLSLTRGRLRAAAAE